MNHGPLIFLGLLGALAMSWLGMIATPQLQIGGLQPTNVTPASILYPTPRSGVATKGSEVYLANGCAYCHTQVVRQRGAEFEVVLASAGTNEADVVQAIRKLRSGITEPEAQRLATNVPLTLLRTDKKAAADAAQQGLAGAGAEASVRIVPVGPDIARGWGTRLTVAQDYLYERPLMLGSARIGPDLANIGVRQSNEVWHLIHLYDPKLTSPGSIMPRYPFLFDIRPKGDRPHPAALPVPGDQEVIPRPEAHALVAYLLSLRAELPLFEAPAPLPALAAAPSAATNQGPSAPSTNELSENARPPNAGVSTPSQQQ